MIYAGGSPTRATPSALLAEGACDLVAMTRALMADPWMPRKAAEGQLDDVRMCVGMQEGCLGRSSRGLTLSCSQNPVTGPRGRAGETRPRGDAPARRRGRRRPAGLEAARVAALRGHEVILYERASAAGRPGAGRRPRAAPPGLRRVGPVARAPAPEDERDRPARDRGDGRSASSPTAPTRWSSRPARCRAGPRSRARTCPAS